MKKDYNLGEVQTGGGNGMDAFFASEPTIVTPTSGATKTAASKPMRTKVGSLQQLQGFQRISAETLVNRSTQDLWAIRKEADGFYIERLFNDDGTPLKG